MVLRRPIWVESRPGTNREKERILQQQKDQTKYIQEKWDKTITQRRKNPNLIVYYLPTFFNRFTGIWRSYWFLLNWSVITYNLVGITKTPVIHQSWDRIVFGNCDNDILSLFLFNIPNRNNETRGGHAGIDYRTVLLISVSLVNVN